MVTLVCVFINFVQLQQTVLVGIAQLSSMVLVLMAICEAFTPIGNTTSYLVEVFTIGPMDSVVNMLCVHANFQHGNGLYARCCNKCHVALRNVGGTPFVSHEAINHQLSKDGSAPNETNINPPTVMEMNVCIAQQV